MLFTGVKVGIWIWWAQEDGPKWEWVWSGSGPIRSEKRDKDSSEDGRKHRELAPATNLELQRENLWQEEKQRDGQNDDEHSEACECWMEGTEIGLCKDSGPTESGQDEKEKGWCGAHQLGPFVDEMEWKSKMVGRPWGLEELHKDGSGIMQKKFNQRYGQKDGRISFGGNWKCPN